MSNYCWTETYTDTAAFANIHFDCFKRFLKLPNGIPVLVQRELEFSAV